MFWKRRSQDAPSDPAPKMSADPPTEPAAGPIEPWHGSGLTAGQVTMEGLGPRHNRTMSTVLLTAGDSRAFFPVADMKAFARGKLGIVQSQDEDPLAFFFRADVPATDSAMAEACQGIAGDATVFAIVGDETRLAAILDPLTFASLANWVRQLPE